MKWFDRMTVWKKLLLAFAIVIAFGVAVGVAGLSALASMHGITEEISSRHMDGLYWMEEANRYKIDSDLDAANLGYAPDEAARQKLKDDIVASLKHMHDAYGRYRETISGSDGQPQFDDVLRKTDVWEAIVHQQIGLQPIPPGVDNAELVRRAIAASEALRDAMGLLFRDIDLRTHPRGDLYVRGRR